MNALNVMVTIEVRLMDDGVVTVKASGSSVVNPKAYSALAIGALSQASMLIAGVMENNAPKDDQTTLKG